MLTFALCSYTEPLILHTVPELPDRVPDIRAVAQKIAVPLPGKELLIGWLQKALIEKRDTPGNSSSFTIPLRSAQSSPQVEQS